MSNYLRNVYGASTPQTEAIAGREDVMTKNSAGGFSYAVKEEDRLLRFLILGAEGGSYYASERKLTQENAKNTLALIKKDGQKVVKTIVEVSEAGRAPKNDPALFALAMCASFGDDKTKAAAYKALPRVARTGTHLFHFLEYCTGK